ncbi:hypothetical protein [Natrinema versiforme]|uniref:Uncharacterized protein n=1 Tax=Natrinema versiforme TaxID=88724 RepID=A0A4V1G016_9EURY|nr:hypothetical protein [Natrinema versiforme]QCS43776.1 hypothetical protein FEJ81_15975 [Natrinema versiforme]
MVSRDTAAHIGACCLAVLVLLVAASFDVGTGTGPVAIAVALLVNGLLFGGGHLYLAIRRADGTVPPDTRWRYVAMLGVLLGGGAIVLYAGDRTIGPVTLETVWLPLFVLIVCSYVLSEAIAGYRASRSE